MIRDSVVDIFRRALAQGAADGRWPAAGRRGRLHRREPARPEARRLRRQRGHGPGEAAREAAARAGRRPSSRRCARSTPTGRSPRSRSPAPASSTCGSRPTSGSARWSGSSWRATGYGRTTVGQGKKVIVEYVSANPTGPMHVGHGRNAVTGDGVQRLLRWAGFDVTREYYVNDYGAQVQTLARSVHLRYQEAHGRQITMPPKSYPGEYVMEIAAGAASRSSAARYLDAPEAEWLDALPRPGRRSTCSGSSAGDLGAIDIEFDRWSSEKALYESGIVEKFLAELQARDLIYVGKLPPPKSKKGAPPPPVDPEAGRGGDGAERRPHALPLLQVRRRGGPAGEEGRRHRHLLLRRHRLPLGQAAAGGRSSWTCSAPTTAATSRGSRRPCRRSAGRATTCTSS